MADEAVFKFDEENKPIAIEQIVEQAKEVVEKAPDPPVQEKAPDPDPEVDPKPATIAKVEADDDDARKYSENVQKRLRQERWKRGDADRRAERAAQMREEAISYAKRVVEENARLKALAIQGEKTLIENVNGRVALAIEKAKENAVRAHADGDAEKIVKSQEDLAAAIAERERVKTYRPIEFEKTPEFTPTVEAPSIDPKLAEWESRNPWFGKDKRKTGYAYGVHEELVAQGIDPRSDAYYAALDREIGKVFSDRSAGSGDEPGAGQQPRRESVPRTSVVAPVVRTQGRQRIVTLTETQMRLARRLGLTTEQYAAQIAKEFTPNG